MLPVELPIEWAYSHIYIGLSSNGLRAIASRSSILGYIRLMISTNSTSVGFDFSLRFGEGRDVGGVDDFCTFCISLVYTIFERRF